MIINIVENTWFQLIGWHKTAHHLHIYVYYLLILSITHHTITMHVSLVVRLISKKRSYLVINIISIWVASPLTSEYELFTSLYMRIVSTGQLPQTGIAKIVILACEVLT